MFGVLGLRVWNYCFRDSGFSGLGFQSFRVYGFRVLDCRLSGFGGFSPRVSTFRVLWFRVQTYRRSVTCIYGREVSLAEDVKAAPGCYDALGFRE